MVDICLHQAQVQRKIVYNLHFHTSGTYASVDILMLGLDFLSLLLDGSFRRQCTITPSKIIAHSMIAL